MHRFAKLSCLLLCLAGAPAAAQKFEFVDYPTIAGADWSISGVLDFSSGSEFGAPGFASAAGGPGTQALFNSDLMAAISDLRVVVDGQTVIDTNVSPIVYIEQYIPNQEVYLEAEKIAVAQFEPSGGPAMIFLTEAVNGLPYAYLNFQGGGNSVAPFIDLRVNNSTAHPLNRIVYLDDHTAADGSFVMAQAVPEPSSLALLVVASRAFATRLRTRPQPL